MIHPKVDSDGNRLGKPTGQAAIDAAQRRAREGEPNPEEKKYHNQNLRSVFEDFVNDDEGYLKLRRGLDSQELHLTWTWCNGKFYGCYVYVRCEWWQLDYGLALLVEKRREVNEGRLKPTPDRRSPMVSLRE